MPMIEFTLTEGALEPDARAEVVEQLTTAILSSEGPPDTPQARLITWLFVHEMPSKDFNVGGSPPSEPRYRVVITMPEGTPLDGPAPAAIDARNRLVRDVTEIVLAGEGTAFSEQEAFRVWVQLRTIRDGYWGSMGTTVRLQDIAQFVHALDGDAADEPQPAGVG